MRCLRLLVDFLGQVDSIMSGNHITISQKQEKGLKYK